MKKIVQMRMGSIGLNGTFKKKGKGRDMLQVFSNCGHSLVLERGPERHCFSLIEGRCWTTYVAVLGSGFLFTGGSSEKNEK